MKKKWKIALSAVNSGQSSFPPLPAAVLRARGKRQEDFAVSPETLTAGLPDAGLLCDLDNAVARIRLAVDRGERITVYGDYDVDGITGVYILADYLKSVGADCGTYIPGRCDEGYGVNNAALERLAGEGTSLVITVDTGITAIQETEFARALGMDLVITDHHECRSTLPNACAVVNPHRPDCLYPNKYLSGVGVAFKLLCALDHGGETEILKRYGDMTAIGTIADVMPLVGENRKIAAYGLSALAETNNTGLRALLKSSGVDCGAIKATSVGYALAPRINAAGRVDNAALSVALFMETDPVRAQEIAEELGRLNKHRQEIEAEIMREALEMIEGDKGLSQERVIVLWSENWHNGIIGIVASKLCERYYKPVILISVDGDIAKGSGRSIPGFHLFEAFSACAGTLEKYGGHELAAGLTTQAGRLQEFRTQINRYAEETLTDLLLVPTLEIDCTVETDLITLDHVMSLSLLEPYGAGNPEPLFCLLGAVLTEVRAVGSKKNHLQMSYCKNGRVFKAIYFGLTQEDFPYQTDDILDVACHLDINSFRNVDTVQLVIRDVRPSVCFEEEVEQAEELLFRLKRGHTLTRSEAEVMIPSREEFTVLWRFLSGSTSSGEYAASPLLLRNRIAKQNGETMALPRLLVALEVLKDAGLLQIRTQEDTLYCRVLKVQTKVDITNADILVRLRELCTTESHMDIGSVALV